LQYVISILTLLLIFAILGLSFNLLIGYSGLFSIAHAAFYGVGAYVAAPPPSECSPRERSAACWRFPPSGCRATTW
jgi:ABC-type branched-subunit amino acid transport system permease subunit